MPTLPEQIQSLEQRIAALQAQLYGTSHPGLMYAMIGSHVVFGCRVTAGFSETDMLLALDGGIDHINPDRKAPASQYYHYPNIANVDGLVFFAEDKNVAVIEDMALLVKDAPGPGYHRSDLVYLYVGPQGPAVGILTGTPVPTANAAADPTVPEGVLLLARVTVAAGVTGIRNADITDLRDFNGRLRGAKGDVALRPRGAWVADSTYIASDLVERNNNLYLALLGSKGMPPENHPEAWLLWLHNDQTTAAAASAQAAAASAATAGAKVGEADAAAQAAAASAATAGVKVGEADAAAKAAAASAATAGVKVGEADAAAQAAAASVATAGAKVGEADAAAQAAAASAATAGVKAGEANAAAQAARTYAAEVQWSMGILAGEMRYYPSSLALPPGWHLCDGSLLLIGEHPALHAVLGEVYGGDGITTFGLPPFADVRPLGGRSVGIQPGDVFSVTLPGDVVASAIAAAGSTPSTIASDLCASIVASAGYASQGFVASVVGDTVTLTGKVADVGFVIDFSSASAPAHMTIIAPAPDVCQVDTITISTIRYAPWAVYRSIIYVG